MSLNKSNCWYSNNWCMLSPCSEHSDTDPSDTMPMLSVIYAAMFIMNVSMDIHNSP
jgi:hypothetical protein